MLVIAAAQVPGNSNRSRPSSSETTPLSDTPPIIPILEPGTQQAVSEITTHVLIVYRGQDVVQKILSLVRDIPGTSFILSANGDIATVTTDIAQYEGNFTLILLRGTFMPVKDGYHQSRASGLRVSFAGQGGQVYGGVVEGAMIAASTIQIILGSYTPAVASA